MGVDAAVYRSDGRCDVSVHAKDLTIGIMAPDLSGLYWLDRHPMRSIARAPGAISGGVPSFSADLSNHQLARQGRCSLRGPIWAARSTDLPGYGQTFTFMPSAVNVRTYYRLSTESRSRFRYGYPQGYHLALTFIMPWMRIPSTQRTIVPSCITLTTQLLIDRLRSVQISRWFLTCSSPLDCDIH